MQQQFSSLRSKQHIKNFSFRARILLRPDTAYAGGVEMSHIQAKKIIAIKHLTFRRVDGTMYA